jgi:signal transduction histidine kinase
MNEVEKNKYPQFEKADHSAEIKFFKLFFFPFMVLVALFAIGFYFLRIPTNLAIMGAAFVVAIVIGFSFVFFRILKIGEKIKNESLGVQSIVVNLEDGLIVYDRDFRVMFFNPAAEHIFNLRAQDVIGNTVTPQDAEREGWKLFAQVIYPTLAPTVLSRSKQGVYPQIMDISFEDPELDFRVTTTPITDSLGSLVGFMKTVNDRTREQFLLRSKSEFVTVASHQLRGPITNVTWALETLSKDQTLNAESRSLVENGLTAGQLLLKIIEDLINVAKIEEGRFGYTFEPIDLAEFINRILADLLPQAKRSGIKLYFDRPRDPLPEVMANRDKLLVVFYNFIDNAIRYNVPNGEVVVKVEKLEGQPFVQVSVVDTGIGIPQDELNKLFGKFFRASNALKFQTEGSGLGLYINRNIIMAHGGQLWAKSELNRGTAFYFTLPTDRSVIPDRVNLPEEEALN